MIVVTGATGFIGQRLIKKLVEIYPPKKILALGWSRNALNDQRSLAKTKRLYGLETLLIDLVNKDGLDNLPKSPETVFHLGGSTDTSTSDFRSNDVGSKNLVRALSPLGQESHVIFASTMVSFAGRKNLKNKITEKSIPVATNGYGRSKLRAEVVLKKLARQQKFRLTILRMPTVYGKGGRKDNFFEFLSNLIQKKSILSRLNWPGLTSFIYVDDAVDVMVKLADKPPAPGKVNTFILSTEEFNLEQVFRLIFKKKRLPYSPVKLPQSFWKFLSWGRRYLTLIEKIISPKIYNLFWRASLIVDNVIVCDNSKLKKYLPTWKPVSLREKIDEVLE